MKTLRFLFVLLLMCSLPLCAFAMDEGYLNDATKWQFNSEVVHVDEQSIGSYCGIYNYYSDLANHCFYLELNYEEDSLASGNNDIYLQFNIRNDSREYQLLIDESGFINSEAYDSKTFNVSVNFKDVWINGQDIYVGIEFLNKEDKKLNNLLSFSLIVNGHTYHICDEGIELAYGDYAESRNPTKPTATETTTAKPSTTKEATTKQTTTQKETTTKFQYTYTTTTRPTEKETDITTEKATKTKTETTTKFKYSGEYSQGTPAGDGVDGNGDNIDENTDAQITQSDWTENNVIITETERAAERSPQAKLLTAMAVICAVAGGALIARNASPKKKTANENNEEE